MKWLAPMLVLLLAPFAAATNYTATKSGDWADSSVWSPSGVPQMSTCATCNAGGPNGDTVTIADSYTISCGANETCSVGNSPSTNTSVVSCTHGTGAGGLAIAPGATFIYAGRVQLCAGTITLGAGAKIQYDSSWSSASTTVNYTWDFTTPASYVPVWLVSGTSASHAVIEGDSFYASTKNSAACTSPNSCLAGAFNHDGSNAYYNNEGQGTISYLDVQDVFGSPVNTHGNAAWVTSVKTGNNSSFDHITFTNSGTAIINETSGATVGLTINGLAITNSSYTVQPISASYPGASGCFQTSAFGTSSSPFLISNAYIDCMVNELPTSALYGVFTWRNVEMYRSPNNGIFTGKGVGIANNSGYSSADVFDEWMIYNSVYITGSAQDPQRPTVPFFSLINSIIFSPKTSVGGTHINAFFAGIGFIPATGNILIKNNVMGSMGVNTASPSAQLTTSFSWGAIALARAVSALVTGNVSLCDQWGYSSFAMPMTRWNGGVGSAITETVENNDTCAVVLSGLTGSGDNTGQEGAIGFEGALVIPNLSETVDSNLFWNLSNKSVPEVCGSDNSSCAGVSCFSPPNWQPLRLLTNNGVSNTNTSASAVCNDGKAGNPSTWVAVGPRNDVTLLNRIPVMVDGRRNLILFDCDYLVPAGYLGGAIGNNCATYWATQTGWKTAWAPSTAYAIGDIVSDRQTGLWGSKTTYWRCTQAHNSGSTSPNITRPSTGVDPSNLYNDYNQFWEPAYFQFFRQQIFNGTVFVEGAVPQLTDINGNPEPMHMIGLLNAWLRQGQRTMEPTLWNGCLNGKECGNSYANIEHMPPPANTF